MDISASYPLHPIPPHPVPDLPHGQPVPEANIPGYLGIPRLSDFIRHHLQDTECQDLLQWVDQSQGVFRIYWLHGSRAIHQERHRLLFQKWAEARDHGREEHAAPPSDTVYKQRFRMALQKASDIDAVLEMNEDDWKYFKFSHHSGGGTTPPMDPPQPPDNMPEASGYSFSPTGSCCSNPDNQGSPLFPFENDITSSSRSTFPSSSESSTYPRVASTSVTPDLYQVETHPVPIPIAQNELDPYATYVTFPVSYGSPLTTPMSCGSPQITPAPQGSQQIVTVSSALPQNTQEAFGHVGNTQGSYTSESALRPSDQYTPGYYDIHQHTTGDYGSPHQGTGFSSSPVGAAVSLGPQQQAPGFHDSPSVLPGPSQITTGFYNPVELIQEPQVLPVGSQTSLPAVQPKWQTHSMATMSIAQTAKESLAEGTLKHTDFASQDESFSYYNGYPVKCEICALHHGQTCICYGHS